MNRNDEHMEKRNPVTVLRDALLRPDCNLHITNSAQSERKR